ARAPDNTTPRGPGGGKAAPLGSRRCWAARAHHPCDDGPHGGGRASARTATCPPRVPWRCARLLRRPPSPGPPEGYRGPLRADPATLSAEGRRDVAGVAVPAR